MTDPTNPTPDAAPASTPTENVSTGLMFSALAIVAAIAGFWLLAGVIGVYGYITGVVAAVIPFLGLWLYTKGAGADPKAGRGPWIGIMVVAILVGAVTIVIASAWARFSRVGGDGGLFAPAFWRTVSNSLGDADVLVPVVIALGAGAFGIYAALRDRARRAAGATAASPYAAPASAQAASPFDAPPAVGTPVPPPAPGTPMTPGATSPGTVLNGEPVDPNEPPKA